jgi:hypothetical protein
VKAAGKKAADPTRPTAQDDEAETFPPMQIEDGVQKLFLPWPEKSPHLGRCEPPVDQLVPGILKA